MEARFWWSGLIGWLRVVPEPGSGVLPGPVFFCEVVMEQILIFCLGVLVGFGAVMAFRSALRLVVLGLLVGVAAEVADLLQATCSGRAAGNPGCYVRAGSTTVGGDWPLTASGFGDAASGWTASAYDYWLGSSPVSPIAYVAGTFSISTDGYSWSAWSFVGGGNKLLHFCLTNSSPYLDTVGLFSNGVEVNQITLNPGQIWCTDLSDPTGWDLGWSNYCWASVGDGGLRWGPYCGGGVISNGFWQPGVPPNGGSNVFPVPPHQDPRITNAPLPIIPPGSGSHAATDEMLRSVALMLGADDFAIEQGLGAVNSSVISVKTAVQNQPDYTALLTAIRDNTGNTDRGVTNLLTMATNIAGNTAVANGYLSNLVGSSWANSTNLGPMGDLARMDTNWFATNTTAAVTQQVVAIVGEGLNAGQGVSNVVVGLSNSFSHITNSGLTGLDTSNLWMLPVIGASGVPVLYINAHPLQAGSPLGVGRTLLWQVVYWFLILGQLCWIWAEAQKDIDFVALASLTPKGWVMPGKFMALSRWANRGIAWAVVLLLTTFVTNLCNAVNDYALDVLANNAFSGATGMLFQGVLVGNEILPIGVIVGVWLNVQFFIPVSFAVAKWSLVSVFKVIHILLPLAVVLSYASRVFGQPVPLEVSVHHASLTNALVEVRQGSWTQYVGEGESKLWIDGGAELWIAAHRIGGADTGGSALRVRVSGPVGVEVVQWWSIPDFGWYFGAGVCVGTGLGGVWLLLAVGRSAGRIVVGT